MYVWIFGDCTSIRTHWHLIQDFYSQSASQPPHLAFYVRLPGTCYIDCLFSVMQCTSRSTVALPCWCHILSESPCYWVATHDGRHWVLVYYRHRFHLLVDWRFAQFGFLWCCVSFFHANVSHKKRWIYNILWRQFAKSVIFSQCFYSLWINTVAKLEACFC